MLNRGMPWWGQIGGPWWASNMLFRAWPIYVTFAFLLAALVAMTVIDARTFTIPIQIPLFVTITAFIAYPLQSILPHRSPASQTWPIYGVNWPWFLTACGGMLGILIALVLLKSGRLRYSFADYDDYVQEDEPLAEYPHARREMRIELLFLLPCIIGLVAGFVVGSLLLPNSAPPEFIQAVGSTLLGYLVGGGLIWTIRILGTLAFDREAMGLGDVHLLAAIGAVLGWFDPILIFFIAPFSGLVGAMLSKGLSAVFKLVKRQLPYGPHLAVATLVVLLCRPGIAALWQAYLSSPMPRRGLVQSVAPAQPAPRPGQPVPIPRLPTSSGSPPLTDGADKLTLQPVGGGSDVASRRTSERKRPCEGYGGAGA